MTELKRTPLYHTHLESGARMVEFGGWDMPVQYAGIIAEHLAVRQKAGMFDVSHMGEFIVSGRQSLEFLQYAAANDAAKLKSGKAHYSILLNQAGGVVDDIYVYRLEQQAFMVVVNASNIEKDFAHLQSIAANFDVLLEDRSDDNALIAAQGAQAAALLEEVTSADLQSYRKNSVFPSKLFDTQVLMARTGYTGEDGFEIFCNPSDAPTLWRKLHEIGFAMCGLGARDTLRLEAGFPLYGHEWNDQSNVLETPFTWVSKEYKDFVGRDAMLAKPRTKMLRGIRMIGRGIPREHMAVKLDGRLIGETTSGTQSPSLKQGIALAYLESGVEFGTPVTLEIRGADVAAEVCEPVFLSRSSPGQ
jgi:aminomethyltransferase